MLPELRVEDSTGMCLLSYRCVKNIKARQYNTKSKISLFSLFGSNEILSKVVHGLNMSLSGNPSNENICSGEADKQQYSGEWVDMPTPKSRIYSKWIR